jgi:threonine dehydrogenase-like Zn-dependent dehydrogenase
MRRVLVMEEPKKIGFKEYRDEPLKPNEVRVRTLYSGISAGTQLTLYRGKTPSTRNTLIGKSEYLLLLNRKTCYTLM